MSAALSICAEIAVTGVELRGLGGSSLRGRRRTMSICVEIIAMSGVDVRGPGGSCVRG